MVIWSLPAKYDLKRIHAYIASDSKYYAIKVSQEFVEKSEGLTEFPKMGRMVPEINDQNIRELMIYSYRLVYEISDDRVDVLAIIHEKQDFTKTFDRQHK